MVTASKPKKKKPHPNQLYPWDRWFARRKTVLQRSDYRCEPHSMGVQIRAAAMKRKLRVRVLIEGGMITIIRREI